MHSLACADATSNRARSPQVDGCDMEATLKASRAVTDYVRTKGPAILQVAKPFPVAAPACVRAPASPQSSLEVCICVYVMCVYVCM